MAEKLIIAQSAQEAVKAKTNDNVYIAGGTEAMRLGGCVESDAFVSVRRIEAMHKVSADKTGVCIGAACTFQELLDCEDVPAYLKEALVFMASRTKRNMATIGGNIAVRRDDSYLIPTLIAAGAELVLMKADGSTECTSAEDYVFSPEKYAGLLITEIKIPAEACVKSSRSSNTAQSHARLTAALSLTDGKFKAVAAVKNSGLYVLDDIAECLDGDPTEDEVIAAAKADKTVKLEDDLLYGGADYRRYLIGITFALMYEELKG